MAIDGGHGQKCFPLIPTLVLELREQLRLKNKIIEKQDNIITALEMICRKDDSIIEHQDNMLKGLEHEINEYRQQNDNHIRFINGLKQQLELARLKYWILNG